MNDSKDGGVDNGKSRRERLREDERIRLGKRGSGLRLG